MKEFIPLASGTHKGFLDTWEKVCIDGQKQHDEWIIELRGLGVLAAHPNDGWVNRDKNYFQLSYPQFNDGVEVDSVVVLGWPGESDKNKFVTVTKIVKQQLGLCRYYFNYNVR